MIKLINFLRLLHILEGNYNSRELSTINFNLVRLPYDIEKEVELLRNSSLPSKEKLILELKSATNYSSMKQD